MMKLFASKHLNKKGTRNNQQDSLEKARSDSLSQLYTLFMTLNPGWQQQALQEIKTLVSCCKALEEDQQGKTPPLSFPAFPEPFLKYTVSSLFIKELWEFLISDPMRREELVLLSGPETPDGTRVLSHIIHVEKEIQSALHVQAADSTHFLLIQLYKLYGHRQFCSAHSHILHGKETTRPSSVDIALQNRLVAIKDDSIGIIVNLDGYIRVYSTWKPFEFHIHGKGIEEIENTPKMKLFQLTQHKQEQDHAPSQIHTQAIDSDDSSSQTNVQNQTSITGETGGTQLQPVTD